MYRAPKQWMILIGKLVRLKHLALSVMDIICWFRKWCVHVRLLTGKSIEHLQYEAEGIKKLILADVIPPGSLNPKKSVEREKDV